MVERRTRPIGGTGGESFDDSGQHDASWGPIVQITVQSSSSIEGIGLAYDSGRAVFHGTMAGERAVVALRPGEFVSRVRVGQGNDDGYFVVTGLFFELNTGRAIGPFGRFSKDTFADWQQVDFGDDALLYLFGRAGGDLDQIGFGHGPQPERVTHPVVRSIPYGGGGGVIFDDWMDRDGLLGRIRSIGMFHGARIDAIQPDYQGATALASDGGAAEDADAPTAEPYRHGTPGGDWSRFDLADDEYLEKIEGYADHRVNQLCFVSDKGNHSPAYGRQRGKAFTLYEPGKVIAAFFGRAGGSLDQIGVVFADRHSAPSSVEITSITFDEKNGTVTAREPRSFLSSTSTNASSTSQSTTLQVTLEKSATSTLSISQTHSASIEVTMSLEIEVGAVTVGVQTAIGYAFQHTQTTEKSNTRTESTTIGQTGTVPAGRWAMARMDVQWFEFDVPWTGTGRITYLDGSTVEKSLSGWFRGVAAGEVNVVWQDAPIGVPLAASDWPRAPLYRLRNPGNNDHLFTTNPGERTNLLGAGWEDEGQAGGVWNQAYPGTGELHRYYRDGLHVYARFDHDRARLEEQGYGYEGVACHVLVTAQSGSLKLYHLSHDACGHILTTNAAEATALKDGGWQALWSPGWILG